MPIDREIEDVVVAGFDAPATNAETAYEARCDEACELAFPRVLEGIAQGASRTEVDGWVSRVYPVIREADRKQLLDETLDDALSQGIEREDVDPSWF